MILTFVFLGAAFFKIRKTRNRWNKGALYVATLLSIGLMGVSLWK
jgi:hypothetical protein